MTPNKERLRERASVRRSPHDRAGRGRQASVVMGGKIGGMIGDVVGRAVSSAFALTLSTGLLLWAQPTTPAPSQPAATPEAASGAANPVPLTPPDELASFLQGLNASDRQELVARQQRFEQLGDAEKDRLRSLHAALRNHPDAQRLDSVLLQYSQWLSTLSPNERYAILDTPADQRVDRIRQLRAREEDQRLTQLGLNTQDARVILDWFHQQLQEHEGKLLEGMDARERERIERIPNDNARKIALSAHLFFNRGRNNRADQLFNMIRREERDRLKALLSDGAREKLLEEESSGNDTEANNLLAEWVRASAMNRFRPPEITDEELLKSLENLPASVRADLERLPRDQMYRALRERFHGFRGEMFDRRRGGRGENRGRPEDRERGDRNREGRERGDGPPPRDDQDRPPFGEPPFGGPGFDDSRPDRPRPDGPRPDGPRPEGPDDRPPQEPPGPPPEPPRDEPPRDEPPRDEQPAAP